MLLPGMRSSAGTKTTSHSRPLALWMVRRSTQGAPRGWVGLGVELFQPLVEQSAGRCRRRRTLELVEQLEEAAGVGELGWAEPGVAAERAPGALDELRGGEAGAQCGGGLKDRLDAG